MISGPGDNKRTILIRRLSWAFGLTFLMLLAEAIGGYLSNSLALLADAGHLFADVFALGLSLGALLLSRLPATQRRTFGYHRTEVLAALINGLTLFAIAIIILFEAYKRLVTPEPVKTVPMLIVAAIGFVVNMAIAVTLHRSSHANLNVRSAYLHVLGDMLASIGVIVGAVVMLITGNYIADPVISVAVAFIILRGAFGVVKEGTDILLESVPSHIDYESLRNDILQTPGVRDLHDLHVWTLSSSNVLLTVHIDIDSTEPHVGSEILARLKTMLAEEYDITHSTVQFECNCCSGDKRQACVIQAEDGDSKNPA